MKVLVLETDGSSCLDFALRCIDAGHDVRFFVTPKPRNLLIGKGLVNRVDDWRSHMRWADLVFVGGNDHYLKELDHWRANGAPIVGPNEAGALWELDRDEGTRVFEKAGIDVPASREFTNYDAAIAYVKREGRRFVSKPCGTESDKSLSYCSKDPADLVFMLERWKRTGKQQKRFVLQEFIPGIEFAVGGWFGPGGWVPGWEENWEEKPLMNDGVGPNTGEQGTVQRFVRKSKMADLLLKPLEDQLERIGYVGCVDVSAIIDERGRPWPLEFTMRPGWPAFNIQQALSVGDPAEWLVDLLAGRDARCFVLDRPAVGVVYTIPDYPHDQKPVDETIGIPLYGLTRGNMEHVHPCMMMAASAPCFEDGKVTTKEHLCSAGTYVLVATGTGETVSAAANNAYKVVRSLHMPLNPQYRTDIGRRLKRQLPLLQQHGFASGLLY